MLSFLGSIADSFGVIVQFISTTISGIISVFGFVGQSVAYLATCYAALPAVLLVFVTAGMALCTLLFFIGR